MSNHRLHDFVTLGKKVFGGIGKDPQEFVSLMDRLRAQSGADIAAGDGFIIETKRVLAGLIRKAPEKDRLPGRQTWFADGNTAIRVDDGGAVVAVRPAWLVRQFVIGGDWLPKNPRDLHGAMLRTAPIFADIGIVVVKHEESQGNPYWLFTVSHSAVVAMESEK